MNNVNNRVFSREIYETLSICIHPLFPTMSIFLNRHLCRQACGLHPNEPSSYTHTLHLCTFCPYPHAVTQPCFSHPPFSVHRHCQPCGILHPCHGLYRHPFVRFVQNMWKGERSDKIHAFFFIVVDRFFLSLHKWTHTYFHNRLILEPPWTEFRSSPEGSALWCLSFLG